MRKVLIITFISLITLIYTNAIFKIHSHSGSWCDYETSKGKVNIQVIQKGKTSSPFISFNMTLNDEYGNEYHAQCKIEQNPEESKDKEEEFINEIEGEEEMKDELEGEGEMKDELEGEGEMKDELEGEEEMKDEVEGEEEMKDELEREEEMKDEVEGEEEMKDELEREDRKSVV